MPGYRQPGAWVCTSILLAVCTCSSLLSQNPEDDQFQVLLKKGFELHQQARFAEAIPLLEQARRLQPADYFANLLLGIDLLRSGKAAEAVPRLQLAAQARPSEDFPEAYLGEAKAVLGCYAQAAEAYQEAVRRGHGSEQALEAWAGFALERFGDLGSALRATSSGLAAARRIQKDAANPTAASCAGSIPALERKLAKKTPTPYAPSQGKRSPDGGVQDSGVQDAESAYQLSICYAAESGKAAEQLRNGAQEMAAVYRLRGDVLLRLKLDGPAAEAEYRKALDLRPGDPALLERMAEAQSTAGEAEAAHRSAQAALAIDPHRREALRILATLAMNDRNYEQALPWLHQLVAEAPGDRAAQVELAKALAQSGEEAEALRYLGPSLAAGFPDEKGALHALLARVFRKLGKDAEAAKAEAEARRLSDAFQARGPEAPQEKPDANQ